MLNLFSFRKEALRRCVGLPLMVLGLLVMSGCASLFGVKKKITVYPVLSPLADATTQQLIAEVNRLASVRSIKGKIDIQIQDNSFAEAGVAEKYRTADGTVYLQRPGQIYLRIQGPLAIDIAQMTSDGEHFRIAVLQGDEKIRRFVLGTNNAIYPKLEMDGASNKGDKKKDGKAEQTVNVLSTIRPQHFTDALMIRPVAARTDSGLVYAKSEFYQEEDATNAQQGKKDGNKTGRVVRGYFLLDELAPGGESGARLLRRFWFDRVGGIRLARVQTYDKNGMLDSDVTYSDPKSFGEGGSVVMPARVELTRPHDRYKLSITYQSPEAVELDHEYKSSVFVLENKWQLPTLDLDERERQRANNK